MTSSIVNGSVKEKNAVEDIYRTKDGKHIFHTPDLMTIAIQLGLTRYNQSLLSGNIAAEMDAGGILMERLVRFRFEKEQQPGLLSYLPLWVVEELYADARYTAKWMIGSDLVKEHLGKNVENVFEPRSSLLRTFGVIPIAPFTSQEGSIIYPVIYSQRQQTLREMLSKRISSGK